MYPFGLFVRVMFGAEVEVDSPFGLEESMKRVDEALAPLVAELLKGAPPDYAAEHAAQLASRTDVLSALPHFASRWEVRGGRAVWVGRFPASWQIKLFLAVSATLLALALISMLRELVRSPSIHLARGLAFVLAIGIGAWFWTSTAGYWMIYENVRRALQEAP